MEKLKKIIVGTDASGAQEAAKAGLVVMIVDVIDMSTSLESALDAGAYAVLGASPDFTRAPVKVLPEVIGKQAAGLARETGQGIILIGEPRVGTDEERLARCQKVIQGIEKAGGFIEAVLPNIGAEVPKLVNMNGRVVVAVSDTGGVAYNAAFMENRRVLTGTIARTLKQRGMQPALTAVRRIMDNINETDPGVAIIAASRNSLEDVLAAQYIANLLLKDEN
ncbi:Uncharacterized [Syntrophomonas zehnderi OL-4]|uniref:Uncharacterized n=1 Tax=Syntrophomonas zehnderi OL-4 TaxID=690567 RepID=A0A0E4GBM5_9FIRM|nr:hypothetical protein [Syntrophomonas zehnderi]CFX50720.1 Uncharacterized [Syntrophomonas zehnderi OL-4]